MNDDYTQHQPIEPTTPVEPEYVKAYTSGLPLPQGEHTAQGPHYGDDYIGIPPPPPKRRRVSLGFIVLCLIIAILLFLSAGLFYLARSFEVSQEKPTPIVRFVPITPTTQPTVLPTRTPTPQPTVRPYDAHSLVRDMLANNLVVYGPQYGVSMGDFYSAAAFPGVYDDVIHIPFVDSVAWEDQYHDRTQGLWVYSSHDIASTVYQKLVADGLNAQNSNVTGRYQYPYPAVYGRCVVDAGTNYTAIVQQYCM